jgi:hypothetical protein
VTAAEPVIEQSLDLRDLFAMKGSATAPADALDEFRRNDVPDGGLAEGPVGSFDPLSFYVGPFFADFDGRPDRSKQRDITPFIDRDRKTIRSLTDQLAWDFGAGVARVNTPNSQGAAGFLARAGDIELGDVVIRCGNEFASVMVISLDDLPLRDSKMILVQAMTEERPYGFATEGNRITDLGGPPFGIRRIDASVAFKSGGAVTVQTLDENGYVRSQESADASQVQLKPDAIYHVILR